MALLPPIARPPHDPTSMLLDGRIGWRMAAITSGVEARPEDGALALAPVPGTGRSAAEAGGSFGGLRPPTPNLPTHGSRLTLTSTAAAAPLSPTGRTDWCIDSPLAAAGKKPSPGSGK